MAGPALGVLHMVRNGGPDRGKRRTDSTRPTETRSAPLIDRRLLFRGALVVLILVFLGLQSRLWIGEGSYAERHRIEMRRDALAQANAKARSRNDAMQAEVNDLKAGDGAAEALAREEMGMIKSGETFFLTVPDEADPADTPGRERSSTGDE